MAWGTKSRQERGYGAAWDRVRKVVMTRDAGMCQPCRKAGRLGVLAQAVDHIISKANAAKMRWAQARIDHPDNLQAICDECHKVKTEAEQGKRFQPKVAIGLDGFPIE
jgi:5-methylcytosine-specific restriction protein A